MAGFVPAFPPAGQGPLVHGLDLRPTWTAAACSGLVSCRGMLPGSSFLRALNSGDEIINPGTSVILSGATNARAGCIGHISPLASPSVYAGVRDFVR